MKTIHYCFVFVLGLTGCSSNTKKENDPNATHTSSGTNTFPGNAPDNTGANKSGSGPNSNGSPGTQNSPGAAAGK